MTLLKKDRLNTGDERVGSFFAADGGRRAVAGVEERFVGQGVELFADALVERFFIAVGEVGAADAAGKDDISNQDGDRVGFADQVDDMSPGVAGDFSDFDFDAGGGEDLAIGERFVGSGTEEGGSKLGGEVGVGVGQFIRFVFANKYLGVGPLLFDRIDPCDMVDMAMGN